MPANRQGMATAEADPDPPDWRRESVGGRGANVRVAHCPCPRACDHENDRHAFAFHHRGRDRIPHLAANGQTRRVPQTHPNSYKQPRHGARAATRKLCAQVTPCSIMVAPQRLPGLGPRRWLFAPSEPPVGLRFDGKQLVRQDGNSRIALCGLVRRLRGAEASIRSASQPGHAVDTLP